MTLTFIARNPYMRQVGVAIASGSEDCVGGSLAWEDGVGVVSVQGKGASDLPAQILAALARGDAAGEIIAALKRGDRQMDLRQIAVVPFDGLVAVHTGKNCLPWAGHRGRDHWIAAGSMLAGGRVLPAMEKAYVADMQSPLQWRLLAALKAGVAAGGDLRGHQSAGIIIAGHQPFEARVTSSASVVDDDLCRAILEAAD